MRELPHVEDRRLETERADELEPSRRVAGLEAVMVIRYGVRKL